MTAGELEQHLIALPSEATTAELSIAFVDGEEVRHFPVKAVVYNAGKNCLAFVNVSPDGGQAFTFVEKPK